MWEQRPLIIIWPTSETLMINSVITSLPTCKQHYIFRDQIIWKAWVGIYYFSRFSLKTRNKNLLLYNTWHPNVANIFIINDHGCHETQKYVIRVIPRVVVDPRPMSENSKSGFFFRFFSRDLTTKELLPFLSWKLTINFRYL